MGRVTISDVILTDVADAIREKTKTSDTISPLNFADMIMSIVGGDENGLFFQEYSSANSININSSTVYIDLDIENTEDIEYLLFFPISPDSGGQYGCNGGVYIPNLFGRLERTSYGSSTWNNIGCGSGDEIKVVDGQLVLHKGQNSYINANILYGIIGKVKLV